MWTTIRRETGLVEHVCSHGVGHPNFYSAARLNNYRDFDDNPWLVHGCDGCCSDASFPGRKKNSAEIISSVETLIHHYNNGAGNELEIVKAMNFAAHDLMVNLKMEKESGDSSAQ